MRCAYWLVVTNGTNVEQQQAIAQRRAWVGRRKDRDGGRPTWQRGLFRPSAQDSELPGAEVRARSWRQRAWSSRVLHRLDALTSHAATGLVIAAAVLAWLAVGVAYSFPAWWETVLYTVSSSITLVMVFAIQHTQTRQQSATQRKLDELLRALPTADNRLIAAEEAPDQELEAVTELNLADREQAVSPTR